MRSALLHMAGDALASLAVVVATVILLFVPAADWLDPVSALVVAAVIVVQAVRVFHSSIAVLLESTPSDVDLSQLTATMAGVPGVGEVHDLHVWSLPARCACCPPTWSSPVIRRSRRRRPSGTG